MTQSVEQLAEQLKEMNARLDKAARARRGGGPFGGFRPFLFGALVGAGAALLYAPQKGEQTRAMLRRNAQELQESAQTAQGTAQQTLAQVTDKVNTTMQDGRAKTESLVQGAQQAIVDGSEKAQALVQDGGEKARAAAKEGGEKVQAAADTAADKTEQAHAQAQRKA